MRKIDNRRSDQSRSLIQRLLALVRLMIDARFGCCRENLMGTLPEWLIATGTVFMLFSVFCFGAGDNA